MVELKISWPSADTIGGEEVGLVVWFEPKRSRSIAAHSGGDGMSVKGISPVSRKPADYSLEVVRGRRPYMIPGEGGLSEGTGNPEDTTTSWKPVGSSPEEIVDAVAHLNAAVDIFDKGLHFRIHEDTEQIVVEVINKKSGEVIRQIPPEYILDVMAKIDALLGVFVDERV